MSETEDEGGISEVGEQRAARMSVAICGARRKSLMSLRLSGLRLLVAHDCRDADDFRGLRHLRRSSTTFGGPLSDVGAQMRGPPEAPPPAPSSEWNFRMRESS
jgi:hypothetical protein